MVSTSFKLQTTSNSVMATWLSVQASFHSITLSSPCLGSLSVGNVLRLWGAIVGCAAAILQKVESGLLANVVTVLTNAIAHALLIGGRRLSSSEWDCQYEC